MLVKTSNPSSGQLQDLRFEDGRTLYQAVADLVEEWGEETRGESGYSAVTARSSCDLSAAGRGTARAHARMPSSSCRPVRRGVKGTDIAGCFDANGNGASCQRFRDPLRVEEARGHGV